MENKEECCCEGTITREGAIHTKNSCCVYIENKEECCEDKDLT